MTTLDIILCLPLAYGLVRGLLRGLVRELTSILSVIAGAVVAKVFAPQLAHHLMITSSISPIIINTVSYVALFLLVVFLGIFINKTITRFLRRIHLGWLNKAGGAFLNVCKWAVIVSLMLNILVFIEPIVPVIPEDEKEASVFYDPLLSIVSTAKEALPLAPDKPAIPAISH